MLAAITQPADDRRVANAFATHNRRGRPGRQQSPPPHRDPLKSKDIIAGAAFATIALSAPMQSPRSKQRGARAQAAEAAQHASQ